MNGSIANWDKNSTDTTGRLNTNPFSGSARICPEKDFYSDLGAQNL